VKWRKRCRQSSEFGIDVSTVRCISAASSAAIDEAAQALVSGSLLGLPTETVYGPAADANNAAAVAAIFAAKGRPADHPLIVHVAPQPNREAWNTMLAALCDGVPAMAWPLITAFWPGPLTLILPRRPSVCSAAAGGQRTVGVRCPSHPVAQAVLNAAATLGVMGAAAPSANRFGRVSPTTAAHVVGEFEGRALDAPLLVLDGGDCDVGIESTIVDVCGPKPVLLRPGHITADEIAVVTGLEVLGVQKHSPQVSGSLASHYAPEARVHLCDVQTLQNSMATLSSESVRSHAVYATPALLKTLPVGLMTREMAADPEVCAHDLFAALRALDATGVDHIWVEAPPVGLRWDGVRDRLKRASAPLPTQPAGKARHAP